MSNFTHTVTDPWFQASHWGFERESISNSGSWAVADVERGKHMEKLWIFQAQQNLNCQQKKKITLAHDWLILMHRTLEASVGYRLILNKTKGKPSSTFSQELSKELKVYGFKQF